MPFKHKSVEVRIYYARNNGTWLSSNLVVARLGKAQPPLTWGSLSPRSPLPPTSITLTSTAIVTCDDYSGQSIGEDKGYDTSRNLPVDRAPLHLLESTCT